MPFLKLHTQVGNCGWMRKMGAGEGGLWLCSLVLEYLPACARPWVLSPALKLENSTGSRMEIRAVSQL